MKAHPIPAAEVPDAYVLAEINSGTRIHIAAKSEDRTLCGREVYSVLGKATSWSAECPTCIRRLPNT